MPRENSFKTTHVRDLQATAGGFAKLKSLSEASKIRPFVAITEQAADRRESAPVELGAETEKQVV